MDKSSKLHSYIKHNKAPSPCMYGEEAGATGGVITDPAALLKWILKEWEAIWGCDDPLKVAKAAEVIRCARDEAILVANNSPRLHGPHMKKSVGQFKTTTSNGANHWTLHDLSCIDGSDMDRLALISTE